MFKGVERVGAAKAANAIGEVAMGSGDGDPVHDVVDDMGDIPLSAGKR